MLRPFSRFCVLIGAIPESIIKSMSYEEQLLRLVKFLGCKVIPSIDGNTKAIKEIEEWINNIDLQDEVNNRLNEMLESGELSILIENLIDKTTLRFDTFEIAKTIDLPIGKVFETYGYSTVGDLGSCKYIVVEDTTISSLKLDNNLYCKPLNNELNVECLGIVDTIDNELFSEIVNYNLSNSLILKLSGKTYTLNNSITIPNANRLNLVGMGRKSQINYTGSGYAFIINHGDRFNFKDFLINCNSNGSAFEFINTDTTTTHLSNMLMYNVEVIDAVKVIDCRVHTGYVIFDRCQFKINNLDGIVFDFSQAYIPEYITISNCYCNQTTYQSTHNNSIFTKISNGIMFIIEKCDIIGFNKGIDISATYGNTRNINIENCSFIDIEDIAVNVTGASGNARMQNIKIDGSLVQVHDRSNINTFVKTTSAVYGIDVTNAIIYSPVNDGILKLGGVIGGNVYNIASLQNIDQSKNSIGNTTNVVLYHTSAQLTVPANGTVDVDLGTPVNIVNFTGYMLSKRGGGDLNGITASSPTMTGGKLTMTLSNSTSSNIGVNVVAIRV